MGTEGEDFPVELFGFGEAARVVGHREAREIIGHVGVLGRIPEGEEAVIILLTERIVGMGMALDATEGGALPDGPGGVDAIDDGGEAVFLIIGSALGIGLGIAMETGGDAVFERGVREKISGEGLEGELIEGHVGVETADEPVAPRPNLAAIVLFVALRVGVAGQIQPE